MARDMSQEVHRVGMDDRQFGMVALGFWAKGRGAELKGHSEPRSGTGGKVQRKKASRCQVGNPVSTSRLSQQQKWNAGTVELSEREGREESNLGGA